MTHRGVASAVHIVTARGKHGESPDYAALAALKNCTLVFLMGRAEAPGICAGLLAAGLPGGTPAAAVENGTMAGQRAVFAPLSKLAERMDEAAIGSPCIITVGETAALAASLRWAGEAPPARTADYRHPPGRGLRPGGAARASGGAGRVPARLWRPPAGHPGGIGLPAAG